MPSCLIELCYLPPVAWAAAVWNAPDAVLEAQENYHKGTYRNRCHIAGPNGLQRLSIPLKGGKHSQMPIREVQVSDESEWQRHHWRSIRAAYGRAPFFEHYGPDLAVFYEKPTRYLWDFNLELLEWLLAKLKFPGNLRLSTHFQPVVPCLPGDLRDSLHPNVPAGPDWFQPLPYPQVFLEKHGFLPNLSLLDLLMCKGRL